MSILRIGKLPKCNFKWQIQPKFASNTLQPTIIIQIIIIKINIFEQ